jgi:hypothetical protein
MNGSGFVEMLAWQMTEELRAERDVDASGKQHTDVSRAFGYEPKGWAFPRELSQSKS